MGSISVSGSTYSWEGPAETDWDLVPDLDFDLELDFETDLREGFVDDASTEDFDLGAGGAAFIHGA